MDEGEEEEAGDVEEEDAEEEEEEEDNRTNGTKKKCTTSCKLRSLLYQQEVNSKLFHKSWIFHTSSA